MPPRKSDTSKVVLATHGQVSDPASPAQSDDDKPRARSRVSVDDNTLPKTIVTRLAKGSVATNTQIQKDAVTAFSRSATVFINYLASAANDITKAHNKKTIMPKDVLEALDVIEFPEFKERLQKGLDAFNDKQKAKRKPKDKAADTTADPMSEDESARPLKRQRKSLANQQDDSDEGQAAESNILEEEGEEDEGGEEAEEEEGAEESDDESGEEEEAGAEELELDRVVDIDREEGADEDEDEVLDDDDSD